jgi:hypothetical protein
MERPGNIPGLSKNILKKKLDFFYSDCSGFTNFYATFAAQAFIHINGKGLVVLQFEYPYRTSINAIGIPSAFVRVHGYLKHRCFLLDF